MSSNGPEIPGDVVHAGFLRRWAALFLDQLILTGTLYLLMAVAMLALGAAGGFQFDANGEPPPWMVAGYLVAILLFYVVAGLYYSLMESSAAQATVGKMALGIKVVDQYGQRLTFAHALGRWFAAALSYLTLYIGFLVAAFTERKQALHDLVAKTLVVDKWAYTESPERQQRGLNGCLIAFLILMGLMLAMFVIGILAAVAIPAYSDYVSRSKVAAAYNEATVVKLAVADNAARGECPVNGSNGIGTPESYASPTVARIEAGGADSGNCSVVVWLPSKTGGESTDYLQLELEPGSSRWTCISNLPERQLPMACR